MRSVLDSAQASRLPFPCPLASWLGPRGRPRTCPRVTSERGCPASLVLVAAAVRCPRRQTALPHRPGPLWPCPSRWPRKVTWTRKWSSSSRRHRWEQGAEIGVRPGGRPSAEVSHLGRRRTLWVGCKSAEPRSGFSGISCRSEPRSQDPLSRRHHDQGR